MTERYEVCDITDWRTVTNRLINLMSEGRNVVLLYGNLGAGKTSLVKDVVQYQSGTDQADSPTFALVNSYATTSGSIHHFDLYRLNDVEEIEDIGFWDYIDSGDPCFVEWPDKIAGLLPPEQIITVNIEVNSQQCRDCSISYSS